MKAGAILGFIVSAVLGISAPLFANPLEKVFDAMSNDRRTSILAKFVNDVEYRCAPRGSLKTGINSVDDSLNYVVFCSSGRSYEVSIDPNLQGSRVHFEVTDCKIMLLLGVDCTEALR